MEALSQMNVGPPGSALVSASSLLSADSPTKDSSIESQAAFLQAQVDMGMISMSSRLSHTPSRLIPSPMPPRPKPEMNKSNVADKEWNEKWRAGLDADRAAHQQELATETAYIRGTPNRTPLHLASSHAYPSFCFQLDNKYGIFHVEFALAQPLAQGGVYLKKSW